MEGEAKRRREIHTVMGIEGSANKIGVGITSGGSILANPRSTHVAAEGQGFLPRDVAIHHQQHVVALARAAWCEGGSRPPDAVAVCERHHFFPGAQHPARALLYAPPAHPPTHLQIGN